jgi:hypothetical protein
MDLEKGGGGRRGRKGERRVGRRRIVRSEKMLLFLI